MFTTLHSQRKEREKEKTWGEAYLAKVIHPSDLKEKVREFRQQELLTITTLNGSFDVFHAGHLHIIFEAKKQGDVLIVALNTDDSIKAYKDPRRPIIPLQYRIQLMAALEIVDYVTWFDETDPRNILSIIKPDVHVNGSEYGQDCIEAETVKKNGGRLHLVSLIEGLSTSQIIKKIKEIYTS